MSSSFVKPSETPRTMLLTSVRVRPWSARLRRSSLARLTTIASPSRATVRSPTTSMASSPLGPFTRTDDSEIVTSTPLGTAIGCFPTRDMSPHRAEHFATDVALARFRVGEQALVRRDDRNAHATEDTGHLLCPPVFAQTGTRRALDAADHALAIGRVLQADTQQVAGLVATRHHVEARDVALLLEDSRYGFLQLRGRHRNLVVERDVRVPQAGQHVGNRVGHRHAAALLTTRPSRRPALRRREPCCAGTPGTGRSRDTPSANDRISGNACNRAP